jgi:hypothetical protein
MVESALAFLNKVRTLVNRQKVVSKSSVTCECERVNDKERLYRTSPPWGFPRSNPDVRGRCLKPPVPNFCFHIWLLNRTKGTRLELKQQRRTRLADWRTDSEQDGKAWYDRQSNSNRTRAGVIIYAVAYQSKQSTNPQGIFKRR